MRSEARPSRTALRVAMCRAAHQLVDSPRVLDDPIAVPIVGDEAARESVAEASAERKGWRNRAGRSIRAFVVARSRFAEDALGRALGRGVTQYVILGAGLDTFAYRNPHRAGSLRVFEVDHPATQTWKRERLAAGSIPIPSSVTFAPVDFERQTLGDGLAAAGFDSSAPSFFSWLGVTMYLTEAAIASTLGFVAATPRGGGIALDYVVPRARLGWIGRIAHDALARRVAAAGEPFRTFWSSDDLRERLTAAGFHAIEDLGADEINARYFAGRADGLRVGGQLGCMASAEL